MADRARQSVLPWETALALHEMNVDLSRSTVYGPPPNQSETKLPFAMRIYQGDDGRYMMMTAADTAPSAVPGVAEDDDIPAYLAAVKAARQRLVSGI